MVEDIDRSLTSGESPERVVQEIRRLARDRAIAARVSFGHTGTRRTPSHTGCSGGDVQSYTPLTSAARALLSTGDINLIRNDSVRTIITAVVATVDANAMQMHDY